MAQRTPRRSEYTDPWWKKEYGGMPGWAVVAVALIIVGIGIGIGIGVASLYGLMA